MQRSEPGSGGPSGSAPQVDLRNPVLAAVLAWLVPGLGHWYQRRRGKAVLYFVCILGTCLYGLYVGQGRVVYASFREGDMRLPFLCQAGVGGMAIPAMLQAKRFQSPGLRLDAERRLQQGTARVSDWFMAPPSLDRGSPDSIDVVNKRLHRYYELGTVFTMIAGLLNILAVFDAWGGPAHPHDDGPGKGQGRGPDEAISGRAAPPA